VLLARRDYDAGVIAPRPGPPVASAALTKPLGFALRLQRGSFYAWAAGLFLLGLAYGSLGQNIEDLLDSSPQAEDILVQNTNASVVDSFFGTTSLTLALIGTAFTLSALGRLRGEETSGRLEPVLATSLGRVRWALTHVSVASGGTVLLFAAAGIGTGLAYAVSGAGAEEVPRLLGAALAQTPAAWVLGSIAVLLFGFAPRAGALAWIPLAFCFVIGTLGPLLGLPDWVDDISPFTAQRMVPAESFSAYPLLLLTVLAVALGGGGLYTFRNRDIG
jgi:ABC-2 type transport system permease protein